MSGKINKLSKTDLRSWELLTLFFLTSTLSFRSHRIIRWSYTALSMVFNVQLHFIHFSQVDHTVETLSFVKIPFSRCEFKVLMGRWNKSQCSSGTNLIKIFEEIFSNFKMGKKCNENIYTKRNCIRMHMDLRRSLFLVSKYSFPALANNGLQNRIMLFFRKSDVWYSKFFNSKECNIINGLRFHSNNNNSSFP